LKRQRRFPPWSAACWHFTRRAGGVSAARRAGLRVRAAECGPSRTGPPGTQGRLSGPHGSRCGTGAPVAPGRTGFPAGGGPFPPFGPFFGSRLRAIFGPLGPFGAVALHVASARFEFFAAAVEFAPSLVEIRFEFPVAAIGFLHQPAGVLVQPGLPEMFGGFPQVAESLFAAFGVFIEFAHSAFHFLVRGAQGRLGGGIAFRAVRVGGGREGESAEEGADQTVLLHGGSGGWFQRALRKRGAT